MELRFIAGFVLQVVLKVPVDVDAAPRNAAINNKPLPSALQQSAHPVISAIQ
jgi:hypothetical protein